MGQYKRSERNGCEKKEISVQEFNSINDSIPDTIPFAEFIINRKNITSLSGMNNAQIHKFRRKAARLKGCYVFIDTKNVFLTSPNKLYYLILTK